jgi:hypothetical protein
MVQLRVEGIARERVDRNQKQALTLPRYHILFCCSWSSTRTMGTISDPHAGKLQSEHDLRYTLWRVPLATGHKHQRADKTRWSIHAAQGNRFGMRERGRRYERTVRGSLSLAPDFAIPPAYCFSPLANLLHRHSLETSCFLTVRLTRDVAYLPIAPGYIVLINDALLMVGCIRFSIADSTTLLLSTFCLGSCSCVFRNTAPIDDAGCSSSMLPCSRSAS